MDNTQTKAPWWFWTVAIIYLLWSFMGCGMYLVEHMMSDAAYGEAFGEDFNLDLKGKKGLINAATVLHKVGQDGKVKLSQISNNCDLYEGTSKKHDKSHVSASICGDKVRVSPQDLIFKIYFNFKPTLQY